MEGSSGGLQPNSSLSVSTGVTLVALGLVQVTNPPGTEPDLPLNPPTFPGNAARQGGSGAARPCAGGLGSPGPPGTGKGQEEQPGGIPDSLEGFRWEIRNIKTSHCVIKRGVKSANSLENPEYC